ncbi:MAG: hypothetical protein GY749_48315 [Desulfobacteraceae bacterium]|nr:hypothetical protein [Desulfobacteraceae bacterium]
MIVQLPVEAGSVCYYPKYSGEQGRTCGDYKYLSSAKLNSCFGGDCDPNDCPESNDWCLIPACGDDGQCGFERNTMNLSCHECTDDWECKASAGDCTSSSKCVSYGEQSFCSQIKEENCEACEVASDCEEKECQDAVCVEGECVYTYRPNCDPDKPEAYYCQYSQAKVAAQASGSIVYVGSISKCWSFFQNDLGDRFYYPNTSSHNKPECCPTLMAMNCIPGPCEDNPDEDPDGEEPTIEEQQNDNIEEMNDNLVTGFNEVNNSIADLNSNITKSNDRVMAGLAEINSNMNSGLSDVSGKLAYIGKGVDAINDELDKINNQEEYNQGKAELSSWKPDPDSFDSEISDSDLGSEFVDARDGDLSEEGWFSDVFGNSLSTVLESANIQLDSPQCSFSFQIVLFEYTDDLVFDFCPYKGFLNNFGGFLVSMASLSSIMIIIGRG